MHCPRIERGGDGSADQRRPSRADRKDQGDDDQPDRDGRDDLGAIGPVGAGEKIAGQDLFGRLRMHGDPRHQLAAAAQVHEEGVWADALASHGERGEHHRLVRGEALRDPILGRALVRRVEHELLGRRIVGRLRLHHQAGLHPCQPLGERKAAELPRLLHGVERGNLRLDRQRELALRHKPLQVHRRT